MQIKGLMAYPKLKADIYIIKVLIKMQLFFSYFFFLLFKNIKAYDD